MQTLDKILAHKAASKVPEWPSYGNFRQVTQTRIFWKSANGGRKDIFQKSPKKMPSFKRSKSTFTQIALSFYRYALKVQRLEKILEQNASPKVPEWPSYGNFRKVTQTRTFWKSANGRRKDIFQKLPKKMPSFKRSKSTFAQIALSFYQYALKVQRLEKILAQNASPRVPEWPSYGNFRQVTQNPHFPKKFKGGTKGNFSKIPRKVALVWMA